MLDKVVHKMVYVGGFDVKGSRGEVKGADHQVGRQPKPHRAGGPLYSE